MAKDAIIACDFKDRATTLQFLQRFGEETLYLKIGMELFYGEGPDLVREIKSMGHRVFLDLKLCDIPNTVQSAMRNIAKLGVDMTNLHAFGGNAMMKAALAGLAEGAPGEVPLLLAVTVLTSISADVLKGELLVDTPLPETVATYAGRAKEAGLAGVVCSPLEAAIVKQRCGAGFYTVTPGIRYPDGDMADQARVTTPADAAKNGCDYIVVGRPVTAAANPKEAYQRVKADFLGLG